MTMEGQIIQNKTVVKQSVYNSPLKVKSVTDTTTVLAGMSSKNQAVAYLTKMRMDCCGSTFLPMVPDIRKQGF